MGELGDDNVDRVALVFIDLPVLVVAVQPVLQVYPDILASCDIELYNSGIFP